mmetsp:Transcript_35191/g.116621  ORF Transcript_35191/g.116621 Transcript_35191/m.116621 type:complete len:259 (+) Transcript_35191:90-866(+)
MCHPRYAGQSTLHMHDPAVSGEEPPSDSGLSRGLSGKIAALSIPVAAVRRALYFFSPSFSASISAFICASSSSTPLCGKMLRFIFSSSSSTPPRSSALNCASREEPEPIPEEEEDAASCLDTSASASSLSTFSAILSNAAIEEPSPMPESMSFTLVAALAVRARAMIWSFLALASAIFASSSFMESYSDVSEPALPSTCPLKLSTSSSCCDRRPSASLASSSSPFSSASCARWYHLSASPCASLDCSSARLDEADTSA